MYNKITIKTSNCQLEKNILKAIEIYNKYRSPEAFARLMGIKEDKIMVKFGGTFCYTCGVRDWIEDLVYILMDHGLDAKLVAYIEPPTNSDNYRIGIFKIMNFTSNSYKGDNNWPQLTKKI